MCFGHIWAPSDQASLPGGDISASGYHLCVMVCLTSCQTYQKLPGPHSCHKKIPAHPTVAPRHPRVCLTVCRCIPLSRHDRLIEFSKKTMTNSQLSHEKQSKEQIQKCCPATSWQRTMTARSSDMVSLGIMGKTPENSESTRVAAFEPSGGPRALQRQPRWI